MPFFPGTLQLWKGLGWVAAWTGLTGLLLLGVRRLVPPFRNISPEGYFLAFQFPAAGLWLSLYRLFFANREVDLIACWEPFMVAVGTVLLPAATGALVARVPVLWKAQTLIHPSSFCDALLRYSLVGFVVLAFCLEMLALGSLWIPWSLWFLSLGLVVFGLPLLIRDLGKAAVEEPPRSWSSQNIILLGALLIVIQAAFLLSCLPPDDSDELRYHLTIPKRYLEHQGWCRIEGQAFSFFPLGMEMLFALPLSLDWLRPASQRLSLAGGGKMVHLWFFMLILMLLHEWSRQRLQKDLTDTDIKMEGSHSLWGSWLYAVIPFTAVLGSWAFVDHAVAFGWLASGYLFWLYWMNGHKENLYLASIALGWSLMVKYTSLAWWFLFILLTTPILLFGRRANPKACLAVVFLPLVCMSPWLIHNCLQTGNPFFPLLSNIFGSGFTPVEKAFYSWHAGMKGDRKSVV